MHNEIIIKAEKIFNKSLENMAESLGRAVTNDNFIEEEIKSTLNSRNGNCSRLRTQVSACQ
jgi:hypothetical protein